MEETEAATIAALAESATEPRVLDVEEIYALPIPDGGRNEIVDLERFLPHPRRKKGKSSFFDAKSFSEHVNRHKTDATQVYRNDLGDGSPYVSAVLNDHGEAVDEAGWQDHQATLNLVRTGSWSEWRLKDKALMSQRDFAEFIEDHIDDVHTPTGAEMLELAQTFQAKTKVDFQSGIRLADGQQQLTYTEDVQASGGKRGELTIPKDFLLGIKPFEGCDAFAITARLRYRIVEGKLKLSFILNKPNDMERVAFHDVVTEVETATGLTTLYGTI